MHKKIKRLLVNYFLIFLISCSSQGEATEIIVLQSMANNIGEFWNSVEISTSEEKSNTITFSADATIMAGSSDTATITRYSSDQEAKKAFEAICPETDLFHGLMACDKSVETTFNPESGHYGAYNALAWMYGKYVFSTRTGYLSTIPGDPVDSSYIAEPLYQSAIKYGLIHKIKIEVVILALVFIAVILVVIVLHQRNRIRKGNNNQSM